MGMPKKGCDIHGVLIVDKPGGMTSSSVVSRLKGWSRAKKVGHTGALDPMATGVLPIVFGEAANTVNIASIQTRGILRVSSSAPQLIPWMQMGWWLLKKQSLSLTRLFSSQY